MIRFLLTSLFVSSLLLSLPLQADDGITSTAGNDLPIGAGGTTFLWVKTTGLVGLGTNAPQSTLDVSGNIRASTGVKVGYTETCNSSLYGTLRYNPTSALLEYCNPSGWVSIKPSALAYGGQYGMLNAIWCYYPNPATSDCSCPSGYTASPSASGMIGPSMAVFTTSCSY